MPELPEVEIVRRRLHPRVVGRTVTGVEVADPKVSPLGAPELAAALVGRPVLGTARRGKWLILELGRAAAPPTAPPCARIAQTADPSPAADRLATVSPGHPPSTAHQLPPVSAAYPFPEAPEMLAIIHLRMTGRLLFEPDPGDPGHGPRFTLHFDDGSSLFFFDVRRFGGLWAVPAAEAARFFCDLGCEPLDDGFTVDVLRAEVAGRRAPLKAFLLDQRRLAGIGNIYADEALFRAGLHPLRPAGSVGPREAQRLHAAIRETLELGIEHEGSSVESFVDPAGERGHFQEILNVYQRTGEPCRVCGTPIRRITVGGRGTHFCPRCQPRRNMRLRPVPPAAVQHAAATGAVRRWTESSPARLYVVAVWLPRAESIAVGALGIVRFERGWYAYVGSARRGRSARVARHMRAAKPLRWHADHLFARRPATRAWLVDASGPGAECALAAALASAAGAAPLASTSGAAPRPPGFGASDCGCPGHLVRFGSLALLRASVAAAARTLQAEVRII